jgi:hypothetical protein
MPLDPVENRKAEAKGASPQASHQSSLLCRGGRMNPSATSDNIGLGPAEGAEARPLSELSGRVLLRLEQAERKETDPHYRDDIRIAWITVLYALRSEPQPHVRATYAVLGVHPDQVFAKIQAFRQWVLAADYDTFFPEVNSPKKPNQSIKNPGGERGVA